MGNGMNRILPGLYVGNYRDSKDAGQLERHRITHIIAIHDAARRLYTDKEYLCITAQDTPLQNLAQYFPPCNDFIHECRLQGGNVLIHCLAGMSRSVTIAVAYIMSITSLSWNEALKVVRVARAVSNPNSGFQKQLQEFESTRLCDERKRMLEKFPGTTQADHEEENCRRLLIAYDHLLLSKAICEGRCASRICPTGSCRAHTATSRCSRQRSSENSPSPRGSTKSLDSTGLDGSPRSWERHYGCIHGLASSRSNLKPSSTPASPILYRASKSPSHRSDSMLSISSISSVTSLPGQIGEQEPSAPCLSVVDRNPFLSTQSCPNSPRRMPRKLGAGSGGSAKASTSNAKPLQRSLGSHGAVSSADVTRLLEKGRKERRAVTLSTHSVSTSSLPKKDIPSTCSPSTSTSVRVPTIPEGSPCSSRSNSPAGPSSPSVSSRPAWGVTPMSTCHRFLAHNAHSSVVTNNDPSPNPNPNAPRTSHPMRSSAARNTIRVASGITRWVMKRSAYKFNLDRS